MLQANTEITPSACTPRSDDLGVWRNTPQAYPREVGGMSVSGQRHSSTAKLGTHP